MELLDSALAHSTYFKIELEIGNIKLLGFITLKEIYNVAYDKLFEGISVIETDNL